MRNMLRNLLLAPIVMATAALATNPAMAQSSKIATIPFKFVVDGHMWPAGRYMISQSDSGNAVNLSSESQPVHSIWTISPGDPSPNDERVLLTFDVQNGLHTLHAVQFGSKMTASLDSRRLSIPYGSSLIVPGQ